MPQVRAAPRRRLAVAPKRRAPIRKASYAAPVKQPSMRAAKPRSQAGNAFRSAGSAGGTLLGTALGGPAGGALGGMLGRGAGAMLSKIFGHGDYQVSNIGQIKENSLVLSNAANIPQFGTGRVAVNFKHREFLGDVISSNTAGAFKIDSYPLNPGLVGTFPWLSQVVGDSFQQHRINGMTFEYRPMSGDALNSTNTALGSVIMATDYDSPDAIFATKQQMENTEYGVSCKPSVGMMHAIECARGQTPVNELYIRAFANPSNTDLRLYDLGRFSIATTGCQAAHVNLGELWVTYDIDAFKAIQQPPGYIAPVSVYSLVAVDATHSLGLTPSTNLGVLNQIGTTLDLVAGVSHLNIPLLGLPTGIIYQLQYKVLGDSTASVALVTPVPSGGMVELGNAGFSSPAATGTSTTRAWSAYYTYDGTGTLALPPRIAIPGGVVPANISLAELSLTQVGAGIINVP
nr:putative capsid protein [Crucivirus sp.]